LVQNLLWRAQTDVDRARRLLNLVARLAREAWAAFGLKLIGCIGTRLAGTGAQLASILLLTAYLDRVLDDAAIALPFVGEVAARADRVIYAAGSVIVGLFLLSGVLNYLYGRWSWRLAGVFELHLIRRAAYTLGAVPLWRKEIAGLPLTTSTVRKVLGGDCRVAQFALRHLLEGVVEPVAIAAWLAAMVWLNPSLTALIVPVSLVALPFVLRVNRRASTMTREVERTAESAAPERRLIGHRLRHRLVDPERDDPWLERFLRSGHIAANARTFAARHIVLEESKVVFTLAFGGLLLLVVWIGGGAALGGAMTWGALVAFLLIMRALLGQIVSLGATFTYLSRFYPTLSRYFALVDGGTAAAREAEAKAVPAASAEGTLSARSLDGDATTIELRTGERIGITTPLGADRQLIAAVCAAIRDVDAISLRSLFGRVAFVDGALPGRGRSMHGGLPVLDDGPADDLVRLLTDVGLGEVADAVHRLDRDPPVERDEATGLSGYFSPAVLLALAGTADLPTVVVDTNAILKIPEAPRRRLLDRLHGRLVLFVYPIGLPFGRLFGFGEKALLVHLAADSDLVYVVRSTQWPKAKARLRSLVRGSPGQPDRPVADDAEDELEGHDV